MISVGLTGGIGSGKSMIATLFSLLQIPVYNSDQKAKLLMEEKPYIRKHIQELLGQEAFINNKLNKPFIASKIFTDETLKNSLNKIVHESVLQDYVLWVESQKIFPYVLQEAAILFETGHYKKHTYTITVSCPVDIRKKRLIEIGLQPNDIDQRIKNQWTDEERTKLADFVILNDEKESVIKQVSIIHEKIISKINETR